MGPRVRRLPVAQVPHRPVLLPPRWQLVLRQRADHEVPYREVQRLQSRHVPLRPEPRRARRVADELQVGLEAQQAVLGVHGVRGEVGEQRGGDLQRRVVVESCGVFLLLVRQEVHEAVEQLQDVDGLAGGQRLAGGDGPAVEKHAPRVPPLLPQPVELQQHQRRLALEHLQTLRELLSAQPAHAAPIRAVIGWFFEMMGVMGVVGGMMGGIGGRTVLKEML